MSSETQGPTTAQLLRSFERLEVIKNKLIKQGVLNGDATPAQVLQKLREILPPDLLQ